ncbi:MAG: AbrB/MazE/SpoVT family DNA-binding domain-containing protein [Gallionella sp.]
MIVTVSRKGQLVIPAAIRKQLGITAGARLNVLPHANGFSVSVNEAQKSQSAAACIGIAGYTGKAIAIAEMDVARYAMRQTFP